MDRHAIALRERQSRESRELPSRSLRTKLLAFTAALVVVPGVLLVVIAERSSSDSLERAIGRQLAREAGHTADRLSDLLRSERETLENFARQDLMREIRVGDIDKRISAALSTLQSGSSVRRNYVVVRPGQSIVASSDPALIGTQPDWLLELAGEDAGVGRVIGPTPGALGDRLLMTAPIPDPDAPQRRLGTLVGSFHWRELTRVTEVVRADLSSQGVSAHVLVVNAAGAVLSGTSGGGDWRLADIASGAGSVPDFAVDATAGLIVGRARLAPDLADASQLLNPSEFSHPTGRSAAARSVHARSPLSGWKLLILESRDEALAPARRSSQRLALVMGVALVVALAIATLAARRVVEPLSELTRAIRALARRRDASEAAEPVPVRTDDEVGLLASAFNEMAADLDRAQRELVEAEKFAFVGELAAGVAHEIRTALNVLGSSTQMLLRSLPSPSPSPSSSDKDEDAIGGQSAESAHAGELAVMIREEVARLGGVVSDLLTLSSSHPLALEPGPLSEPLFRAADFVAPQAQEKGIEILRCVARDEPRVWRDSDLIQQVAVNLLVNAIQALGHGGCIELRVLHAVHGTGGFEVKDDGKGIPEELRERIFQPFVTARDGGVGLGLTFVKRVVHDHRGRISLTSEPGTGACFHIELPLADGGPPPSRGGGRPPLPGGDA